MTHDPKAVESVAEAINDAENAYYNIPILWEEMTAWQREPYRLMAEAALDAVNDLYDDDEVAS